MVELTPGRQGDQADVVVNIQIKAKVPYYLANQGMFARNIRSYADGLKQIVDKEAKDLDECVIEISIVDPKAETTPTED